MIPSADLPVDDPILIFAIAMLAFLSAPLLLHRYRLPGIVGIILLGALIGPNGVALLDRGETFILLGEVGIVYLMFLAGLEINFNRFIAYKDRSIVFGLLSFLIPQLLGTIVAVWVFGMGIGAALLFASIFASHTLLAYPVVNTLDIAANESVTATIGGTIITDTLALLVLAGVIASVDEGIGIGFWLTLAAGLTVYFVGMWVLVPKLGRWFFRAVDEESYFEFLFVMVVVFVSAYLADLVGVEHIIGAFLAGLILNRQIPKTGPLMNRIEFVGNALFIPFFLISVGMLVDFRVLFAGIETIAVAGTLIVLVVTTKYAAAAVTARIYSYTHAETLTMFGLSVGQAAAALAIVLIGFEAGLLGEIVLNATILMILVVSVVSPAVVDRYGRELARDRSADVDRSLDTRRVMVPFSLDSQYREELLELALLVRGDSTEPLYTLTVAHPRADAGDQLADIEEFLAKTEHYSAGAEVPVETRTRLKRNPASGIVEAALENRISTLILGWDGAASRRQSIFGHTIDRVLARTTQLVLVSHVRERIGLTRDVVLVLPPEIVHNAGYAEAVRLVNRIATDIGASVRIVTVVEEPDRTELGVDAFDATDLSAVDSVPSWPAVREYLQNDIAETDLVVLMSARRGTMGWQTELATLPTSIATLTDGNFLVLYPASRDQLDDRQFLHFR